MNRLTATAATTLALTALSAGSAAAGTRGATYEVRAGRTLDGFRAASRRRHADRAHRARPRLR